MAFSVSLATRLKSLFLFLGLFATASLVYTAITDGLPFRRELLTPWMAASLIDFFINIFAIWAWIVYKEASWVSRMFWLVLLAIFGSIAASSYILLQFLKLSPKESTKAPIYFVLLRHKTKSGEEEINIFSVRTARYLSGASGCLMLGTLICTIATAGSPFHRDVLFPWLTATLIDFYLIVTVLMVWVAYKEASWIRPCIWAILFICFGSIGTCTYLLRELFRLSSDDPVHIVLFNDDDRVQNGYQRTNEKESSTAG